MKENAKKKFKYWKFVKTIEKLFNFHIVDNIDPSNAPFWKTTQFSILKLIALNESTSLSYQGDRSLTFQTFFWFPRNLTFVTDIDYLAGRESFRNFYQVFVQTFWPTWSPKTVRPGGLETPIAPISRCYACDTTIHLWPSFAMHQKDRRANISTFRYLPGAL